jgi:hypothetical protein
MSGSTISGTIDQQITLGVGIHLSPLTITKTGEVENTHGTNQYNGLTPTIYVSKSLSNSTIFNHGTILSNIDNKTEVFVDIFASPDSTLSVTNTGVISGQDGIVEAAGGYILNSGTISEDEDGISQNNPGIVLNTGFIYGTDVAAETFDGSVTNSGTIFAGYTGVLQTVLAGVNGEIHNSGLIMAGGVAVQVDGGTFVNTGRILQADDLLPASAKSLPLGGLYLSSNSITANTSATNAASGYISAEVYGVKVTNASLTNAGTISGGKDAVYGTSISLTIEPGAVFIGDVVDTDKNGLLELQGKQGWQGGIGGKFIGFQDIDFASGSEWTIQGSKKGLASGQEINGFAQGDKIVLGEFAATSDTYVTGVGLVLANTSGKRTLDITGSFTTGDFNVTSANGNTHISLVPAHSSDQIVVLDAASRQPSAEMRFLSPVAHVDGASGVHVQNSFSRLFDEIRGASYAVSHLPKIESYISRSPADVATLAANGVGPAISGLIGLSEQHYVNSASVPLNAFEKL